MIKWDKSDRRRKKAFFLAAEIIQEKMHKHAPPNGEVFRVMFLGNEIGMCRYTRQAEDMVERAIGSLLSRVKKT